MGADRSAPARPAADPLTATETRLHLTVSPAFLAKLEQARLALSHARPQASAEAVLSAGLDLILAHATRRRALVARPRRARPPARRTLDAGAGTSDRIPAHIRREVWGRDEGCCQWKTSSGAVCGSRYRPELDHIKPRALGGESTADNLRVLCRRHNLLAARLALGDAVVDRHTRSMAVPSR